MSSESLASASSPSMVLHIFPQVGKRVEELRHWTPRGAGRQWGKDTDGESGGTGARKGKAIVKRGSIILSEWEITAEF